MLSNAADLMSIPHPLPSKFVLSHEQLTLCCKAQSQQFGRRLYHFEDQAQTYWLKTHLQGSAEPSLEQAYLNELHFYQQHGQWLSVGLPYQTQSVQQLWPDAHRALILPHAPRWLSDDIAELKYDEVADRIRKMLDVVQQLHQYGYLHADLKREHFVCWQQQVKLIDFEQAHPIDQSRPTLTATPRYMAPELFHHHAKTVQTDLYAVGIILYEWLSEQRLAAKTYSDWAYLHCQRLEIILPERFKGLEEWLKQVLAKKTEQRFADIQAAKYHFNP